MQKYTAKDIREQRISFGILTEKQFNILKIHFQKLYPEDDYTTFNFRPGIISSRFYKSGSDCLCGISRNSYTSLYSYIKSTREISFEEFDFEDILKEGEFITLHNIEYNVENHVAFGYYLNKTISSYENNDKVFKDLNIDKYNFQEEVLGYSDSYKDTSSFPFCKTLEDLTKFINAIKEYKMKKEIIGYKLIKPEYTTAALKLADLNDTFDDYGGYNFKHGSWACERIKKAGVLDLWFEPVYKSNEEVFSMGSFNLTIKDKKVYHNTENITSFVKDLVETLDERSHKPYAMYYKAIIKDITFSKTGCEHNETKLSDWIKVYNKIK